MPIDRAATLRQAEKLLRQGKLDQAIAEYVRLVEDQPRDWNTANVLGDLYVRAGHLDRAIDHFSRIAESLVEQGFLPRASAVYKRILKLKPDADHALVQAGELAAQQGLLADARAFFAGAARARRTRGDTKGALEIVLRVGGLDRSDIDARPPPPVRVSSSTSAWRASGFNDLAIMLIGEGREATLVLPSEAAGLTLAIRTSGENWRESWWLKAGTRKPRNTLPPMRSAPPVRRWPTGWPTRSRSASTAILSMKRRHQSQPNCIHLIRRARCRTIRPL